MGENILCHLPLSFTKCKCKRRGEENEKGGNREKLQKFCIDLQEEESEAPYEEVSGHKFVRQPRQRRVLRDASCLACKKRVRGLIREWFRCKSK